MPRHRARLLPFPAVVVFSSLAILSAQAPLNPPVAKKMPKQTTLHGVTLVDDYHWLRDKGSPKQSLPSRRRSGTVDGFVHARGR